MSHGYDLLPVNAIADRSSRFSEKYGGAHFVKLDVDEVPDAAQELGIRAMPTFIVFKDGQKVNEVVGANAKALEAAIQAIHEQGASAAADEKPAA